MRPNSNEYKPDGLLAKLNRLWIYDQDKSLLVNIIRELDDRYNLYKKIASEPGVEEIITQMYGRLSNSYRFISDIQGKRILDIACGSNTSRAPAALYINTPFKDISFSQIKKGYTALFEPWFCRILFALKAEVVGIDFGDLEGELFSNYRVDLGQIGALNFLPDHSFEAVQDSRLFGSPEFTAQFPNQNDRLKIAQEILHQEQRLLKAGGIVIHSDAEALFR